MAKKRRSAAQIAATAKLVASNAARRSVAIVRSAPRAVATRARTAGQSVIQIVRRRPRSAREAGLLAVKGGTVIGIAQAKGIPGAMGGYVVAAFERSQRKAHVSAVGASSASSQDLRVAPGQKPLIVDPRNRLLAEGAVLALIASKTTGVVRDGAIGAMGALGAFYELYSAKDGLNPVDDYRTEVLAGRAGV